ncbi:MAG: PDZ domain-containing protein [Anaerolineae bacterium]
MAKEFLSRRGVPFIEKDVSRDREAAMDMIRRSGNQGVPQILVGNEIVIGFDRPRLEGLLRRYETAPSPGASGAAGVSLGVSVADASKHAPQVGSGAYVGNVKPNTPAADGGIRPGDVIVALDGQTVRTADDVLRIGPSLQAGRSVAVVIVRDDKPVQLTLPT